MGDNITAEVLDKTLAKARLYVALWHRLQTYAPRETYNAIWPMVCNWTDTADVVAINKMANALERLGFGFNPEQDGGV